MDCHQKSERIKGKRNPYFCPNFTLKKDSGLSYLVLSTSHKNPFSDGANRSYCIGILLNSNSLKKIKFAKSTTVKSENVGVTCETCSIIDCDVRKTPPTRLDKENFNESMKKSIAKIRKEIL